MDYDFWRYVVRALAISWITVLLVTTIANYERRKDSLGLVCIQAGGSWIDRRHCVAGSAG